MRLPARTLRVAALLVVAVAAMAGYLAHALRVDRDFVAFLPRQGDAGERFLTQQLRDGAAARLALIRIGGGDADARAAASEALKRALAVSPAFDFVSNGSLADALADLPRVESVRYLVAADAAARMSVEGLRESLARRYEAIASASGVLEKRWLYDDPTGEMLAFVARLQAAGAPRRVGGVWSDPAGEGAMLVARTRAPASDADAQRLAREALDEAFARVGAGLTLEASSGGWLALASASLIKHDVERLSWVATAGILAILLFAYRSPAVVALCALPACVGLLAGLTAVVAGFGSVHAITLAFGTTLLGEAVDYPTYLLTAHRGAEGFERTRATLARPFALAVATTACGAAAFLLSGVDGLVQVGVLTSIGIVVAGALAWWAIPALVPPRWRFRAAPASSPSSPGGSSGEASLQRGATATAPAPAPASRARPADTRAGLAACAGVTVLLAFAAWGKPVFGDDPGRMNPLPRDALARDAALRAASGAPDVSRFVLVRAQDDQALLEGVEAAAAILDGAVASGVLVGYDAVTRYVPSAAAQRARQRALPDAATLESRLAEAVRGTPFRAAAFAPFVHDVDAARSAPPITAAHYQGTAIGLKVAALLGHDAQGPWALMPLVGVGDAAAIARALAAGAPGAALVDLRTATTSMFAQFRARTGWAIMAGILAVFAILLAGLRSLRRALLAIAPALVGASWSALAMVAFGGGLSLFHLIALALVVGIGVNYALFAQDAVARGASLRALATTLAIVAATTLVAFAAMATSTLPVLRGIGSTVAIGIIGTLAVCALTTRSQRAAAPARIAR